MKLLVGSLMAALGFILMLLTVWASDAQTEMNLDSPGTPRIGNTYYVALNAEFPVTVQADVIPKLGYDAFQTRINWPFGLELLNPVTDDFVWPDCVWQAIGSGQAQPGPGTILYGCVRGIGAPESFWTGSLLQLTFRCGQKGLHTIEQQPGPGLDSFYTDPAFVSHYPLPGTLNVNCVDNSQDTDGDGCSDAREIGPDETLGGQRDPNEYYDFFDTDESQAVGIADIAGVVSRFGATGDPNQDPRTPPPAPPAYHPRFDRTYAGPNPWNLVQGNGAIGISDIAKIIAQFGHTCQ